MGSCELRQGLRLLIYRDFNLLTVAANIFSSASEYLTECFKIVKAAGSRALKSAIDDSQRHQ